MECPLGALPNAHTLMVVLTTETGKHMETFHYMSHGHARQTSHLIWNLSDGYSISGGPVNVPEKDGVGFKYIYTGP